MTLRRARTPPVPRRARPRHGVRDAADFPQPRRPVHQQGSAPLQELPNLKPTRAGTAGPGRRTPPPGPRARPPHQPRSPRGELPEPVDVLGVGEHIVAAPRGQRERRALPSSVAAGRCGSTPPVQPIAGCAPAAPSSRSSSRSSSASSSPASAVTEPGGVASSSESDASGSSSLVSRASSADAASDRAPSAAAFSSPSLDPKPRTHAAVATGGATRAPPRCARRRARQHGRTRSASLDSVASLARAGAE